MRKGSRSQKDCTVLYTRPESGLSIVSDVTVLLRGVDTQYISGRKRCMLGSLSRSGGFGRGRRAEGRGQRAGLGQVWNRGHWHWHWP